MLGGSIDDVCVSNAPSACLRVALLLFHVSQIEMVRTCPKRTRLSHKDP